MARVLESLGGVADEDVVFVSEATRAALLAAFDRLASRVAAARVPGLRREVVVYYSGHSDEDGLLIGTDRLSYDELRARIQAIPAEVRLAILDSCASGAFTRHKGGVRRPPFLMDSSADTKGHAFLTSSAVNEVAQESDRIGASFFTHYLVSGLRGAADVNRDRRVTLQEAFQFAAQETLARTEKTQGGPQHAAYEFDLVGTSDLVVTDVRSTQATLALAPELAGRISVREATGNLVVELRKAEGHPIELGLEAGPYIVAMEGGTMQFEASVTLALGQRTEVGRLAFHPARPLEVATARGDGAAPAAPPPVVLLMPPPVVPLRPTHLHLGIVPLGGEETLDVHGLSFGFIADRVGRLSSGLQLSIGANIVDHDLWGTQLAVGVNILRGGGAHAVQVAAGLNFADGAYEGAQIVSGANVAHGSLHGAQLAGGINYTGGAFQGAQLSGGANIVHGPAEGLQAAGGASLATSMHGLQMAGGASIAGTVEGVQLAPVNLAGGANGLQLGVVNYATEDAGAQLGVVNVSSRSRGFKFGVINISREHDGETFGILNLIGNGIHDVAAYATDTMLSNLALKLGSQHIYTSFLFAYNPGDRPTTTDSARLSSDSRRFGVGLGFGYRRPLSYGRLRFLEVEVAGLNVGSGLAVWSTASSGEVGVSIGQDRPLLASARVVLGFRLAGALSGIVGIGENVAIAWGGRDLDIGSGFLETVQHEGGTTVRQYPGFLLGLQL
jgi:hypothetical protein